jgi:hypothetical protein
VSRPASVNARLRAGLPFIAGAVTALALGVHASAHDPSHRDFVITGFDSVRSWKAAFSTAAVLLFASQLGSGLRVHGRIGPTRPAPPWLHEVHRLLGTLAFALTIPVVFHCIWSIGYETFHLRQAIHSAAGCIAYGLYVAKVLAARKADQQPTWVLPVTGSLVGVAFIVAWWGQALWFYQGGGSP